ncbi:MAG: SDR family NAD(P)-dependent oxidoreductase [Thermoproteota archaeon]|nr:SDR family NAD(P)-dependent oxidoreductase [Thermoproteota archaeon]
MEGTPLKNSFRFDGRVVVVTGSGTGIGQSIAKRFAESGASIIILGRRTEPLQKTASDLKEIISKVGSNGSVRIFSGVDVSDENAIDKMFHSIKEEIGNVDILVNNAGVSGPVKIFTNSDFKEFKECVAIHLTGTYWTTVRCLQTMKEGSKIITISTFFTEENRFEQRPYRFRTPYTSAQGAKNRLAEALAWELVPYGIRSVATNPGPVHSDRIYKTVYPKAAAEFLRIGGYPGLTSSQIDRISPMLLELLGEDESSREKGLMEISKTISESTNQKSSKLEEMSLMLKGLLEKIQEIAEKVQTNTKKMIVDEEFLSQDDVAEMVLNLSQDSISRLINGRVVPNDRVFYPVRPIVGTFPHILKDVKLSDKVVVIIINSTAEKDHQRGKLVASSLNGKVRQLILLTLDKKDLHHYQEFHCHSLDLSDEDAVNRIFQTAKDRFSSVDGIVTLTGEFDYNVPLLSLNRRQWDELVEKYLMTPALVTREAVKIMAPSGALLEPSLFRGSKGKVIIIGPDAPMGKKISGLVRARSEVFRGALRPFNATVNQELRDVLNSNIRQYLLLCGNMEGNIPSEERIRDVVLNLLSDYYEGNNQTIFYPDEF